MMVGAERQRYEMYKGNSFSIETFLHAAKANAGNVYRRVCLCVCLSVCLCVLTNQQVALQIMSCSVDHPVSGCEYSLPGVCMFVCLFR